MASTLYTPYDPVASKLASGVEASQSRSGGFLPSFLQGAGGFLSGAARSVADLGLFVKDVAVSAFDRDDGQSFWDELTEAAGTRFGAQGVGGNLFGPNTGFGAIARESSDGTKAAYEQFNEAMNEGFTGLVGDSLASVGAQANAMHLWMSGDLSWGEQEDYVNAALRQRYGLGASEDDITLRAIPGASLVMSWFDGEDDDLLDREEGTSPGHYLLSGVAGVDLQDPQAVAAWVGTDAYKFTTGMIDGALRLALDPDVGVGKAAKLARLRAFHKPLVKAEDYARTFGKGSQWQEKVLPDLEKLSEAQFHQKYLKDHVHGAEVAAFLKRAQKEGGRDDATDLMRAFAGDEFAIETLQSHNRLFMDDLRRLMNEQESLMSRLDQQPRVMPDGTERVATDMQRVDRLQEAILAQGRIDDAFDASLARAEHEHRMERLFRTIKEEGDFLNSGTVMGRDVKSLKGLKREASFNAQYNETWQSGPFGRVVNVASWVGEKKPHTFLRLDHPGSHEQVRRQLRDAGMDVAKRDELLSEYIRATNASERASVYTKIEDEIVAFMAARAGMEVDQIDAILTPIRAQRQQSWGILADTRQHRMYDGKGRGLLRYVDENGKAHKVALPMYVTQEANVVPMANVALIKQATSKWGRKRLESSTLQVSEAALDGITRAWKTSTLLRPAWATRTILLDEQFRALAKVAALAGVAKESAFGAQIRFVGNQVTNALPNMVAAQRNMRHGRIDRALTRAGEIKLAKLGRGRTPREQALADIRAGRGRWLFHGTSREVGQQIDASGGLVAGGLSDAVGRVTGKSDPASFGDTILVFNRDRLPKKLQEGRIIEQVMTKDEAIRQLDEYGPEAGIETRGHIALDAPLKPDFVFTRDELIGPASQPGSHLERFLRRFGDDGDLAYDWLQVKHIPGFRWLDGAERGPKAFTVDGTVHDPIWSKGDESEIVQRLISSRASFDAFVGRTEQEVLGKVRNSGDWRSFSPADAGYYEEWSKRLNMQIGQDAVMRQILNGKSRKQIKEWLFSTPQGRSYFNRMESARFRLFRDKKRIDDAGVPVTQSVSERTDEWLEELYQHASDYTAGRNPEVVKAALRGEVDRSLLEQMDMQPIIHGEVLNQAMGRGPVAKMFMDTVDSLMQRIGTLPTDKLLREPLAANIFQTEVKFAVKRATEQGRKLDQKAIDAIRAQARDKTVKEIRDLMFDFADQGKLEHMLRYAMPFFGAWQEAIVRWAGIAIENPATLARARQIIQAPEAAEGGITGISEWEDDQGNTMVSFTLPDIARKIPGLGGATHMTFMKSQLNLITEGPGFGFMVTLPINEIVKGKPQMEEAVKWFLPYGTTEWYEQLLPSIGRRAVAYFGKEGNRSYAAAMGKFWQTEVTRFEEGKRDEMPTREEIKKRTDQFFILRAFAGGILPAQPQFPSPYKFYEDQLRALREDDPATADERFIEDFGEQYWALTQSVTKSNLGVPPTMKGHELAGEYGDMLAAFPDLASFIIGPEARNAEFNRAVYNTQLETPVRPGSSQMMRESRDYVDWEADGQRKLGWMEYSQAMEYIDAIRVQQGLPNYSVAAAAHLAEAKRVVVETLREKYKVEIEGAPGQFRYVWYEDFRELDQDRKPRLFKGFYTAINDERLRDRPDVQAVRVYLAGREAFVRELQGRAEMGMPISMDATDNMDLRQAWDSFALRLTEEVPGFAELYHRYFERDLPSGNDFGTLIPEGMEA